MQTRIRSTLLVPALVACFATGTAYGQTQDTSTSPALTDPTFVVKKAKDDLRIVEKFAKVLQLKRRITTVSGFDQTVISVTKVDRSPNMIRVHAEAPGVTSLVVTDEDKKNYTLEVFVIGDVRHLQAYLNKLFPHSSIKAMAIKDSVILRGWVSQPEHITEIREIAAEFYGKVIDQMKVGGVQQVQLKVRVMEVQRAKIRRLGFNFLFSNSADTVSGFGALGSTPGQLTQLAGLTGTAATVAGVADPTVAFSVLRDGQLFQGFVEALKEESLLKILAEPEIVATNGRPASMVAGGEFPILVPQSLGTATIEWREFGVRLQAVPIILGRGRVRLELEPEVSERDFTNAVVTQGFTVPGLTTRRVNTQVEMRFGETFMIAGLLSTRTTARTSKIPLLGELPWIGAAFRRVRYEKGETELVIMVTPELVSPMKSNQIPQGGVGLFTEAPVDRELYIDGVLEVPNFGRGAQYFHNSGVDNVFSGGSTVQSKQGVSPIVNRSGVIPGKTRVYNSTPTQPSVMPMPPLPANRRSTSPTQRYDTGKGDSTSMRTRGYGRNRSTTRRPSLRGIFTNRRTRSNANIRTVSGSSNDYGYRR